MSKFIKYGRAVLLGCVAAAFFPSYSANAASRYVDVSPCNLAQRLDKDQGQLKPIDYDRVRKLGAPLTQIKAIIAQASSWRCLPNDHWFRIGFDPFHPDVVLNEKTHSAYREKSKTIYIYLQYEFQNLEAQNTGISVTVYFSGEPDRVFIPYKSITWFDDPDHNFLLKPQETKLLD